MKLLCLPFRSPSSEVIAPDHDYEYHPLETTGGGELRLIRLWPGPVKSNAIRLEIFHAMKDSEPVYEALSYAWGSATHTDVAFVCGAVKKRGKRKTQRHLEKKMGERTPFSSLGIAHNLAVALRHLRHRKRERILWVDAICINQIDKEEKSREVLQMGSIYSNARQVIVWLGPGGDDSALALQTLGRIGSDVRYDRATYSVLSAEGSWAAKIRDNKKALQAEIPSWVAISKLLRRDWFSRLWVFQEVTLAKASTIHAGESFLDWEKFRCGMLWIGSKINEINLLRNISDAIDPPVKIIGLLHVTDRTRAVAEGFLQTLDRTRQLLCYDDRDRLFAIRGILGAYQRDFIQPDYSLPTEEIYKATTISWMNWYGRLDILQNCVLHTPPSKYKMPSWVSDFSYRETSDPIKNIRVDGYSRASFSIEWDTLAAHGVRVGHVSEVWTSLVTKKSTDKELIDVCRTWMEQLSLPSAYVAGGLIEDVFIEAILGGSIEGKAPKNAGSFPSSDDCKHVLMASSRLDEVSQARETNDVDRARVLVAFRRFITGRAFFRSAEGYIGTCPDYAKSGDLMVVLLGCRVPLILRPDPDNEALCVVVGACYVPGIMNAEALLGSLPPEWTRKCILSKAGYLLNIYEQGSIKTQQDPRASALPQGWRVMFGTFQDPLVDELEDEKDWDGLWYENLETGQRTSHDPRLTPELLRERGVDIQEFKIV
ncbi:hypothetical protein VTL71DRAFT_4903 [Oculimacula yallundae]|uniref:Heterokaryon incompatibility domain-containing protein n=1 Tax=Oculimacula yallundae TaxID=86028 RepID=A0ABR4C3C5_9HELO